MRAPGLGWLALGATACVTHLPPNALSPHRYEQLPWAASLDEARATGVANDKPVMMVLAAGELSGAC